MTFAERLNEYMRAFRCTPKMLVSFSGVSGATISRYRAGAREPSSDSDIFGNIVNGLRLAALNAGLDEISDRELRENLASSLSDDSAKYDTGSFGANLDMLINELHMQASDISSSIGMEPSRFFRIRTGHGRLSDTRAFCSDIGRYIYSKLVDDSDLDILSDILGCTPSELDSEETVCAKISGFLTGEAYSPRSYAESFLRELDSFGAGDYISALDESLYSFSDEAERDFISAVKNAELTEPAIICTDLYSGEAEESRQMKNLVYMIAMLVQKGIHINLVLNADNPMDKILPGLISLMPVSMSGNISTYYLKGRRDGIYRYRLVSLENAAMCCEALTGHYDSAVIHTAESDDEIRAYRLRARQILSFATPMIEVIDSAEKRLSRLSSDAAKPGKMVCVLSTPPFYTMSVPLLDRILARNNIPENEADEIRRYLHTERQRNITTLSHSQIVCSYPELSRENYKENPVFLSLSGLLYNREILCTYEEYTEHIRLMREFEKDHPGFRAVADMESPFRNVQIFMSTGRWVMLSKNKTPTIHLYIKHSKLRRAFENMLSPYGEGRR